MRLAMLLLPSVIALSALMAGETTAPGVVLERLVQAISAGQQPTRALNGIPELAEWAKNYGATVDGTGAAGFGRPPAWGYITEQLKTEPDIRHLYLHVFHPPETGVIELRIPATAIKACRAFTEACVPIDFSVDRDGIISIPLPKTRDALDTVIELDLTK